MDRAELRGRLEEERLALVLTGIPVCTAEVLFGDSCRVKGTLDSSTIESSRAAVVVEEDSVSEVIICTVGSDVLSVEVILVCEARRTVDEVRAVEAAVGAAAPDTLCRGGRRRTGRIAAEGAINSLVRFGGPSIVLT